ncbi:MAG: extensin family protein [Alphaproteobacteria bacterium]|nr:extensin family protein [Alphaproteobacteria bacterium]
MKLYPFASLVVAAALALPALALAQTATVPLPERNPQRTSESGAEPTLPWLTSEVVEARAECDKLLAEMAIEYEALPPIRRGICGTPAPIRVKAIGSNPQVAISPPAIMNCKLAVALNDWLREKVQPEARKIFNQPVVRLRNAASYACRNRNSNPNGRLSEHAKANALDISEFTLETGVLVTVLDSWPRVHVAAVPPLPEPNPVRLAAAAERKLPVLAASYVLPQKPRLSPVSHVKVLIGNTTEVTKVRVNPFVVATPAPPPVLATPSLLAPADPPPRKLRPEYKSEFVRSIYAEACKNFGTTLGPSADAAHRNHFHFDMKYRRAGYCR